MNNENQQTSHRPSRRSVIASVVAVLAAVALSGCGTMSSAPAPAAAADGKKVLAINFPGATKNVLVQSVLEDVKKIASAKGYDVVVDDPAADLNKQLNTLTTWIQQGVSVIICQPIAPESVEGVAAKAKEAGVKWVTYGVAMKNQNGFVGFDHKKQAENLVKTVAGWVKKNPGVEPKIALLTYQTVEWARAREKGFDEAIKAQLPNAKIVARQDALSQSDGLTAMSTILQAHPDANIVLAVEETASEGAYQALLNAGHPANDPSLFVGGIDGSATAFKLLQGDTFYRGSSAIAIKQVSQAMVDVAIAAVDGQNVEKLIEGVTVVSGDKALPELLAGVGN
jgi:ribose transport system substrate-binding protein